MLQLVVLVASTRPGRAGLSIATWFDAFARRHNAFEVVFVDLAEVGLPLLDEPAHPRLQQYTHAHTQAWSAIVEAADAFVFVTPEYNYGPTPALVNALDYVYNEWNYKPVGFVSYGGLSGGIRAVQMTKQIVTTLKMVPLVEAVNIPFVAQHLSDRGDFVPTEIHEKSATDLLRELERWAEALKPLRAAR